MNALDTARLHLRPLLMDDLEDLAALTANPEFMRFSLGTYSRKETVAFLEKFQERNRQGTPSLFAVVHRTENKLIGYCGFLLQTVDHAEELEIAYRIDPLYWGRGIATEAARSVRDHAFEDLHLNRVISLIHPDNIPSRRVAEKNGMLAEKTTLFRGFPTIVYAINRGERTDR